MKAKKANGVAICSVSRLGLPRLQCEHPASDVQRTAAGRPLEELPQL
ncbi:MAG: hypothetical protein MZV70_37775 [Desulfobacterales bacterium]|nr:hypothetical protein [Desulfobacterales bacterium]